MLISCSCSFAGVRGKLQWLVAAMHIIDVNHMLIISYDMKSAISMSAIIVDIRK
jgi:hypothetical protein